MGLWTGRRIDGEWVGGGERRKAGECRRRRAALEYTWLGGCGWWMVWVVETGLRLGWWCRLVGDYSVAWQDEQQLFTTLEIIHTPVLQIPLSKPPSLYHPQV